ncbi:MAG: ferredoxin-type protein NapG [Azoarcus sp.]|jgi:ferredoxin-type protein NapG|nr:ferredoxin-type protein NapG [Azoarcus sp.]
MSAKKSTSAPERIRLFPARRRFLAELAGAAGSGCLMALGAGLYANQSRALGAQALRPPGALPEKQFLAACTRCGLCVRDCPYGTLKLATPGAPAPTGTPYFTARSVPCEMCEDIPCIKPCPTGALDPALTDIAGARMGLAVLIDQETCLNFLGLRCDVCYRVCPVIDQAITLEKQHNARSDRHAMLLPTVHSAHCTGCGKCEAACVLAEAAIKVLPAPLAQGKLGEHYRKGWEEREKHGGSLIGDQLELPVRGLEGKPYGDSRVDDTPAPPAESAPGGIDSGWKP